MQDLTGYYDSSYLEFISPFVKIIKEKSYKSMNLKKNDCVLDVGCGPGIDMVSISKLIGAGGRIFGIDKDFLMLCEAMKKSQNSKYSNMVHIHSYGEQLPFKNNTFDSVRSERVFQHAIDPLRLLSEMKRVVKKKGKIAVIETDWSTLTIDTNEYEIEQRIKNFSITKFTRSGLAARQLFRFFTKLGFSDVTLDLYPMYLNDFDTAKTILNLAETEQEAVKAGIITEKELKRWQMSLNRDNIFFGSITLVMISGTNF